MNSGMISVRYARALYSYAIDKEADKVIFDETKKLAVVYNTIPDFKKYIENPIVSVDKKIDLIKQSMGNNASQVFQRFIQLVFNQNREAHLCRIALAYQNLYRKENNITIGRLTTANPFDSTIINKIKKLVQKTNSGEVEFVIDTDPDIGGGFILYVDTYRLDASIATQLKNIKKQLLNSNKRIT